MIEEDLLKSSLYSDASLHTLDEFKEWFKEKSNNTPFEVIEIPLSKLSGWKIDKVSGNLQHESGKFFSIQGVSVDVQLPKKQRWEQPLIVQPEVGILGILMKYFNGLPHFLMQLKIEPGNINKAQLSPTVQATKSNYTRVHKGKSPPYLDFFIDRMGTVISDQLQSEQGARFLHKRNRNMVILIEDDVEVLEGFYWLTLHQIKKLFIQKNLVNMDARSVLSTLQLLLPKEVKQQLHKSEVKIGDHVLEGLNKDLLLSLAQKEVGLHRMDDLISWFTWLKSLAEVKVELMPLKKIKEWVHDEKSIYHKSKNYFSVVGVETNIGNREVLSWSQPLLKHDTTGLVGLLAKRIDGVLHFLVQGRMEPGYIDSIEMGPTVTCSEPERRMKDEVPPPFLEHIFKSDKEQIVFNWILSEEGGRFYHFENNYRVVLLNDDENPEIPRDFIWMSYGQLLQFVRHSLYLNIELRTILSGLSVMPNQ